MKQSVPRAAEHPTDFDEIVRKRTILLVPLSEAHMGQTNASALRATHIRHGLGCHPALAAGAS